MSNPDKAISISDGSLSGSSSEDDTPQIQGASAEGAEGTDENSFVPTETLLDVIKESPDDIQGLIEKLKNVASLAKDPDAVRLLNALLTFKFVVKSLKEMREFVARVREFNCKEVLQEHQYLTFMYLFGFAMSNEDFVRAVMRLCPPLAYIYSSPVCDPDPTRLELKVNHKIMALAYSWAVEDHNLALLVVLANSGMPFSPYCSCNNSATYLLNLDIYSLQSTMYPLLVFLGELFVTKIQIQMMTVEDLEHCAAQLHSLTDLDGDKKTILLRFLLTQETQGRSPDELQSILSNPKRFLCKFMGLLQRRTALRLTEILKKDPKRFPWEAEYGAIKLDLLDSSWKSLLDKTLEELARNLLDVRNLSPQHPPCATRVQWYTNKAMWTYKTLAPRDNDGTVTDPKYVDCIPTTVNVLTDWPLLRLILAHLGSIREVGDPAPQPIVVELLSSDSSDGEPALPPSSSDTDLDDDTGDDTGDDTDVIDDNGYNLRHRDDVEYPSEGEDDSEDEDVEYPPSEGEDN